MASHSGHVLRGVIRRTARVRPAGGKNAAPPAGVDWHQKGTSAPSAYAAPRPVARHANPADARGPVPRYASARPIRLGGVSRSDRVSQAALVTGLPPPRHGLLSAGEVGAPFNEPRAHLGPYIPFEQANVLAARPG